MSGRSSKPDVVLLDIRMPVMDGRTTLDGDSQASGLASLPVIAVTASSKAGEEDGACAASSAATFASHSPGKRSFWHWRGSSSASLARIRRKI